MNCWTNLAKVGKTKENIHRRIPKRHKKFALIPDNISHLLDFFFFLSFIANVDIVGTGDSISGLPK